MSENTINMNETIALDKKNKKEKNKGEKRKERKKREKKSKRKKISTYLKETRYELKQVSWSSRKETLKNTWTVLLTVFLSVLICYGFDSLISFGLKLLVK